MEKVLIIIFQAMQTWRAKSEDAAQVCRALGRDSLRSFEARRAIVGS